MENRNNKVKRGEIYLFNFGNNEGAIQNGIRPAMIVQCNEANTASRTTVIAALTSAVKKQYLPTHIVLGKHFGLKEPSMVMLEQLRTVNQDELGSYIGIVDEEPYIRLINNGLKKGFGIWAYKPPQKSSSVRCLCPKCLKDYMDSGKFVVRRVDPFARVKEKCYKCDGTGYDYLIIEQNKHSEGDNENV